jgi:hypothetical protein
MEDSTRAGCPALENQDENSFAAKGETATPACSASEMESEASILLLPLFIGPPIK